MDHMEWEVCMDHKEWEVCMVHMEWEEVMDIMVWVEVMDQECGDGDGDISANLVDIIMDMVLMAKVLQEGMDLMEKATMALEDSPDGGGGEVMVDKDMVMVMEENKLIMNHITSEDQKMKQKRVINLVNK